jgi:heptosyltransferase III
LGGLGDFILTFPSIIELKKTCPTIDILAPAAHGKLAQRLGLIRKWYAVESAVFASLFGDSPAPQLRQPLAPYDHIILFSFSGVLEKSMKAVTSAEIHKVIPRPEPKKKVHVAQHLLEGTAACGLIRAVTFNAKNYFWDRPSGSGRSQTHPSDLLVHPGAGSPKKMWPLAHFVKVIQHLGSFGIESRVVLGPAEIDLEDEPEFVKDLQESVWLPPNLDDLLTLLEKASGFVGNDSGVSHLAGFCGLPTVTIFGPSDPIRWQPLGPHSQVVAASMGCDPCFETDPDRCDEKICLAGISPEVVMSSIQETIFPQMTQMEFMNKSSVDGNKRDVYD